MSLPKDKEPSGLLSPLMVKATKLPVDPSANPSQSFYDRRDHRDQILDQRGKKPPRFTGRIRS